jgi:protein-tyrosine-phosphatase/DNA-binding HxlR family transcriptional regulator
MSTERVWSVERRAGVYAALADPARLAIVDVLWVGDAAPSELAELLGLPSNLLAHHVRALEQVGVLTRRRSEGDRRRTYLRLVPAVLGAVSMWPVRRAARVLFVCTANSARSQLAVALWRRASPVPASSAGTHPAERVAAGAVAAARRHDLPLRGLRPRQLEAVRTAGDLVVTVCDRAHEELSGADDVHWSVADPVPTGTPAAFDRVLAELAARVAALAPLVESS